MKYILIYALIFSSISVFADSLDEIRKSNPGESSFEILKMHYEDANNVMAVGHLPYNQSTYDPDIEYKPSFKMNCVEVEEVDESKIVQLGAPVLIRRKIKVTEEVPVNHDNGPLLPTSIELVERETDHTQVTVSLYWLDWSSLAPLEVISNREIKVKGLKDSYFRSATYRRNGAFIAYKTVYLTEVKKKFRKMKLVPVTAYGYCWKK